MRSDQLEQATVERCFLDQGALLANYHKFYWMGLLTGMHRAIWPNFTWIDQENAIYVGDYQHWGVYQPGFSLEPNNMVAPENCAGSNLTMGIIKIDKTYAMDGLGGWADRQCGERYPFICEIAPSKTSPEYTARSTGSTFRFYADPLSQADAEAVCNEATGHLASYADIFEQAEVEAYFRDQGYLLPAYHKSYWLGLVADPPANQRQGPFSSWRWLDYLPPPSKATYQHWGTLMMGNGRSRPEPNNLVAPELCAAANASQAYDEPSTWGWADANCTIRMPFMCKTLRKWLCCHAGGAIRCHSSSALVNFEGLHAWHPNNALYTLPWLQCALL